MSTKENLGFIKLKVVDFLFNVKVTQCQLILTLGDQRHEASIEDCKGDKVFCFNVTFHAQLFGTVQLDLVDRTGYFYSAEKHLGRTEIRLNLLKAMPTCFTSFYEIWHKTLSSGASSSIGRERTRVNNIGALQIQIEHQFLSASEQQPLVMSAVPASAINLLVEEQLAIETKRHTMFHRERKKKNSGELRNRYDSGQASDPDDPMQPLAVESSTEDEEDFGDMVSATSPIEHESKDQGKNQVVGMVSHLLAAFGQGFELTHLQVITGLSILEKFFESLPRPRISHRVSDLSEIEMASRFWKFSVASYGWKGLNLIGKGNGILSDAIREHSDARSVIEYLAIPKEDLLSYNFGSSEAFRPSYFIARDRFTSSIVLSIRGTMSLMDTLTDLVCEYEPWKGGFVHSGMKRSAIWFFQSVMPQLLTLMNESNATLLIIVGHSLGAATAAILTDLLMSHKKELEEKVHGFDLKCFGYAPACGQSLELAERHKDVIQSFVFAEDIASKMSYGSMMDLKELIIASVEASQNGPSLKDILLGNNIQGEKWQIMFERIAEVRQRLLNSEDNPRLYVAGQVYQFWEDLTQMNKKRIDIEKTAAENVCYEVVIKKSILTDHLPSNFDLAFGKAREAIMLQGSKRAI
ncbi:hypothetical protein BY458DRAFT_479980 [Sporodiniella umbellata]|nr:hypothetical protein BY458DRAFT_479980 [Sporodiniella umbellata]